MGSVVVGLWAGAFIIAYVFGMIEQRLKDAVENEVSHLQLHHPEFDKDHEVRYFIPNAKNVFSSIEKDPSIKAVSARVVVFGMVASAQNSTGGKVIGVLPASENRVTGLKEKLTEGSYFEDDSRNKVIIGERLAEKLKVKIRSKIVLTFQDTTGSITAGAFRIIGLYKTYNSTYDETNIFVRAPDLSGLLNTSLQYHEIALLLKDPESMVAVKSALETHFPDTKVESWKELAPELGLMIDSFDQYMIVFIVIIMLALSFGIVNTMLMAVLERVREIGMLMAVGMNRLSVFVMIFLETLLLVLIASPIGLSLAYLTIQYLGTTGMDLSGLYQEGYAAYGFKSFIYPKLENSYYLRIMIMVTVTALLASIYPAFTAVRLNPVTAIRKI